MSEIMKIIDQRETQKTNNKLNYPSLLLPLSITNLAIYFIVTM